MPKIEKLRSVDRSQTVALAGTRILSPNVDRVWAAFVNEGANIIDIYWIDFDGVTVTGKVRLAQYGTIVIDRNMPWYGALSATALVAPTVLCGVEVFKEQ